MTFMFVIRETEQKKRKENLFFRKSSRFVQTNERERERERERKDFDPFFCVIYLFDMVIEKEKVQLI